MGDAITDAELDEWERLACVPSKQWEHGHLGTAKDGLRRLIAEVRRLRGRECAPVTKVTECVGRFVDIEYGSMAIIDDGCRQWRRLDDFMPDVAVTGGAEPDEGPRGRFRITVEFWPEEPPK